MLIYNISVGWKLDNSITHSMDKKKMFSKGVGYCHSKELACYIEEQVEEEIILVYQLEDSTPTSLLLMKST